MKNSKKWIALAVILMLFGTFFDLQLSEAVVGANILLFNLFARFFEIFGEFAMMLTFALGCGYFLAETTNQKSGRLLFLKKLVWGTGLVSSAIGEFILISRYVFPEGGNSHGSIPVWLFIVSVVCGLILAKIIFVQMLKLDVKDYDYYRKVAIFGMVFAITIAVTVQGIKLIWARPRYWYILTGKAEFMPWYIINGMNITQPLNACMSFVSGHTANAFLTLGIALWFKNNLNTSINLALVWGTLVAISRICAGQHFLTDTIMGGVVATLIFTILLRVFKLHAEVNTRRLKSS